MKNGLENFPKYGQTLVANHYRNKQSKPSKTQPRTTFPNYLGKINRSDVFHRVGTAAKEAPQADSGSVCYVLPDGGIPCLQLPESQVREDWGD